MQSNLEKLTIVLSISGVFLSLIITFTAVRIGSNKDKVLRQARKKLQDMTLQDDLTKIANRRHFDEKLQEEWHRMLRNKARSASL